MARTSLGLAADRCEITRYLLDILSSCQPKLVNRPSCCGDTAPREGGHRLLGPAHPSTMAALAAPCTAGSISFSRSVSSTQSLTASVTLPSPYGLAIRGCCQHCRVHSGRQGRGLIKCRCVVAGRSHCRAAKSSDAGRGGSRGGELALPLPACASLQAGRAPHEPSRRTSVCKQLMLVSDDVSGCGSDACMHAVVHLTTARALTTGLGLPCPPSSQTLQAGTASACCVQLRFARFGRKGVPFYRLVAIDSRAQRDGKPIEVGAAAALPSIAAV